jgi:hypothetical protein
VSYKTEINARDTLDLNVISEQCSRAVVWDGEECRLPFLRWIRSFGPN